MELAKETKHFWIKKNNGAVFNGKAVKDSNLRGVNDGWYNTEVPNNNEDKATLKWEWEVNVDDTSQEKGRDCQIDDEDI